MTHYDLSEIDFPSIKPVAAPKPLKEITHLYRACRFEEADKLLEKNDTLPRQTADIKAQLAFFSCDFDKTVQYILEYYPYLNEWYAMNKKSDTEKMLAFSLAKSSEDIKNEAISILDEMYGYFSEEQLSDVRYSHFKAIPRIIDIAKGNYSKYAKGYTPPESPKEYKEIFDKYAEFHKSQLKALKCAPEDDPKTAGDLIYLIEKSGKPEDITELYEADCKSTKLHYNAHLTAIRVYLYLNDPERAEEAAVDYVKYGWLPITETDIMPVSLFDDYCMTPMLTNELLSTLKNIPHGVDEAMKQDSDKLKFGGSFDDMFEDAVNKGAELVKIAQLSVPSGKITAADPLMYMGKDTLPYSVKLPKGEYEVKALISGKRISAVMISFTESKAVKYINALVGDEAQAEIDELEEGEFFGFPVDSGLAAICDDKVKREFIKFTEKWEKKHKNENIYDGFFKELFIRSAEENPIYSEEWGSFLDFVIPDTEYHIPMISCQDGYPPVFFGFDNKNKPCSMVILF